MAKRNNRNRSSILRKGKTGKIRSKPTEVDGIKFRSKLEAFTHRKLKENNILNEYESEKYVLLEGFYYTSDTHEQSTKGYINRGKEKVRAITYTPDFLCPNRNWIIECKGFANDRFPLKWKMFKNLLRETNPECKLFVPKNQKQVLETIEIIKNLWNESNGVYFSDPRVG